MECVGCWDTYGDAAMAAGVVGVVRKEEELSEELRRRGWYSRESWHREGFRSGASLVVT
jgi:hypothetical protein